VIDPRTGALLQAVVRRESLSLLSYVGDAFPWATAADGAALAALKQVVAEDRAATAVLRRWMARRRVPPPYVGSYPVGFTTLNFVALDHLLPRLLAEQRRAVADLERDRSAASDAEAKAELDKLLAAKRRHVAALEGLTAPPPAPAEPAVPHPEPATH
jgi:hypothetical protein